MKALIVVQLRVSVEDSHDYFKKLFPLNISKSVTQEAHLLHRLVPLATLIVGVQTSLDVLVDLLGVFVGLVSQT